MLEEVERRVEFFFNQYLLLRIPLEDEEGLYQVMESFQVPYKIVNK